MELIIQFNINRTQGPPDKDSLMNILSNEIPKIIKTDKAEYEVKGFRVVAEGSSNAIEAGDPPDWLK